jgi:hypothetical protein
MTSVDLRPVKYYSRARAKRQLKCRWGKVSGMLHTITIDQNF